MKTIKDSIKCTQFTAKKAQSLIDTQSIVQIDDSTYQIKSSTPGKSYIISDGICECVGFKFRGECSHVQAAEILQEPSYITSSS